jgi:membrane fusion protein
LKARLANNIAERNHIDEEIELASNRLSLAEKSLNKYAALQKSGFVSDAQTQQKEEDRLDLKARLSTLQRSRIQLQANQLAVESDLQTLETALAAELAALDKEDASLGQELLETQARKSIFITAPQAGTVTTVTYEPGQSLNAGQPLATIVARRERGADTTAAVEVHLYAPSRTAGFVAPGQQVMLRFDAFPYQKFGLQQGVVASVSRTPFAPAELPANLASTILSNEQKMGGGSNEALYRIKVRLERQAIDAYGHSQAIVPGMTVSGDIVQERRSIWEWIIDPIVAATARQ